MRYAVCAAGIALALSAAGADSGPSRRAREAADRSRTKIVILKTARHETGGSATGFLARPGLTVTAGHAVSAAASITAWLNGVSYRAGVVASHPDYDLAVLRLHAPELQLKPVQLAPTSAEIQPGEELLVLAGPAQGPRAMGEPNDRVLIPARFRARGPVRDPSGKVESMLTLDASVERGDSGSPVLRARDGAVVGVLSSRELPDEEGVSHTAYAVPVEALNTWLNRVAGNDDFYLFRRGE
jgi:S1-C subfamily serine protease